MTKLAVRPEADVTNVNDDPLKGSPLVCLQAKETVIVVHGTWAAPDSENVRWYQPVDDSAQQFTTKLNDSLRERGSRARCWAHCADGNQIFCWSGENSWIARTNAAVALGNYVASTRSSAQ
jgi:hypothetical protein